MVIYYGSPGKLIHWDILRTERIEEKSRNLTGVFYFGSSVDIAIQIQYDLGSQVKNIFQGK